MEDLKVLKQLRRMSFKVLFIGMTSFSICAVFFITLPIPADYEGCLC